jgi:hypothetical protein
MNSDTATESSSNVFSDSNNIINNKPKMTIKIKPKEEDK